MSRNIQGCRQAARSAGCTHWPWASRPPSSPSDYTRLLAQSRHFVIQEIAFPLPCLETTKPPSTERMAHRERRGLYHPQLRQTLSQVPFVAALKPSYQTEQLLHPTSLKRFWDTAPQMLVVMSPCTSSPALMLSHHRSLISLSHRKCLSCLV